MWVGGVGDGEGKERGVLVGGDRSQSRAKTKQNKK